MLFRIIKGFGLFGFAALCVVALFAFSLSSLPSEAQQQDNRAQQSNALTTNTCMNCHNNPGVAAIFDTPHGLSSVPGSPAAGGGCASCHGDSATHAQSLQSPGVVFSGRSGRFESSAANVQNQTCLNCHESRETVHWTASAHDAADVTCASCHSIHANQTASLDVLSNSSLCITCHLEQRSQINRRSHHPLNEGLMSCNDCHNPHGSETVALLAKATVNESCTTCHTEKRGPFLWEHQPVNEDCTTCHNPHGSNQTALLSTRQPFLCQSCHSEAFHPSSLYSGSGAPPAGAAQSLLGSSCTSCHSSVHGSNHPSGSRLTR
jgi:DmsE family decaheme c-type cytochrome